jgi:hypothetical protein
VRYFHSKGISQAAATSLALAATAFIVAFALATQLPSTLVIQRVGVEQAGAAEEAAGIRLSLVALLPDGYAVIANDGTRPVTLNKLFTPGGIMVLNPPITIQPGQKVSINVGYVEALAAGVEGGGNLKVVLKEKPGLQLATATTYTSCCVTTSYVLTRSSTLTYTTYTPYTVTRTEVRLITNYLMTTTITHTLTECITCQHSTTRTYTYSYYYTPYTAILQTVTATQTAILPIQVTTSTTTLLDTMHTPWRLYYLTYITTTLPSVTTTTTTATMTATLPTYTTTTSTTTTYSARQNTLTSTSVTTRPTVTTYLITTVTSTTVVVG